MGTCCCNGQGFPSDGPSCQEQGGCTYWDGDNVNCGGVTVVSGTCAVLGALSHYLHVETNNDPVILLATGGTVQTLYDLRDIICTKSPVGKQLLAYYHQYASRAMNIISSDPALLREALRVVLMDAAFGRAVLSGLDGRNEEAVGWRRYTREMHESGLAVLAQLRKLAADGEFDEPVAFLEREGARFVGMNGREILAILMEGDLSGKRDVQVPAKTARRRKKTK